MPRSARSTRSSCSNRSPTLSTMPTPVLKLVLKDANLETIQVLRKVCRSLRYHIDSSQLDSRVQKVTTYENPPGLIWIQLFHEDKALLVEYKKIPNGCEVKYGNKKKLLYNQDFGAIAANDLGLILQHQKSKMEELSVGFSANRALRLSFDCLETTGGRYLAALEPYLKSRKSLLAVKYFEIKGTKQEGQILKVLPYLDPTHLESIEIKFPPNPWQESSGTIKLEEIVELDQWKQARKVEIRGLTVDSSLENFLHFNEGEFELKQASVEDLILLREKILERGSCNLDSLTRINLCFHYRRPINKKLFIEKFGRHYPKHDDRHLTWYYKFPVNGRTLDITWCEEWKRFTVCTMLKADPPEHAFD